MSTSDPLAVALDRFTVPAMSAGFADRVVAAASAAPAPAPASRWSRDRRGAWRRGRHVLLGTAAVGLLSAAAVASGLLGSVGIEVPVLTAMLAPKPSPKPHVVEHRLAAKPVVAPAPSMVAPPPVMEAQALSPAERFARRVEQRERLLAFAQEHPRAAAVLQQRVRQQLAIRDAERRAILGFPPADPSAPGFRPLTDAERFILRRANQQDARRAAAMIDRRLMAREAKIEARRSDQAAVQPEPPVAMRPPVPPVATPENAIAGGNSSVTPLPQQIGPLRRLTPEERAQLTPEQRAARREFLQQRRAERARRGEMRGAREGFPRAKR